MKKIIYLLVALLSIWSCENNTSAPTESTYIPPVPNYNDSLLWYTQNQGKNTDVFYVTPTCIFDWKPKQSEMISHHYDVYGEVMKENFDYSLNLAKDIFGEECNFYAPYYRQISLESWLEDDQVINERFNLAMQDVQLAFNHYLQHQNLGKDFILAGYSQGAKAVVELVKKLKPQDFIRMKAAYVIGYQITQSDLQNTNVHPAQGEKDQGVIICYNSVKTVSDIWAKVCADNQICINPINWKVDTTIALLNDSITVQIDTVHHVLLINGYKEINKIPLLENVLTPNNYHLSELTLFQENLKKNVKHRLQQ